MTYASIVLTLLKIVSMIMDAINQKRSFDAGVDHAIAEATQQVMAKTRRGKAILDKVNGMTDAEVDAGLRGLEP